MPDIALTPDKQMVAVDSFKYSENKTPGIQMTVYGAIPDINKVQAEQQVSSECHERKTSPRQKEVSLPKKVNTQMGIANPGAVTKMGDTKSMLIKLNTVFSKEKKQLRLVTSCLQKLKQSRRTPQKDISSTFNLLYKAFY